jgi:hypothetical protein
MFAFEELDFSLVLYRGGSGIERAEIAALVGVGIDFAGIEAVLAGF